LVPRDQDTKRLSFTKEVFLTHKHIQRVGADALCEWDGG
jgi:hypothetical protein